MPRLRELGFEVEHLYYADVHDVRPQFEELGLCSHFIHRDEIGRLAFLRRAVALMRCRRYDVVHAFLGTTNLYVRLPAFLAGVPVIFGGCRDRHTPRHFQFMYGVLNFTSVGWILNSASNALTVGGMPGIKRQRLYVVPNLVEFDDKVDTRTVPFDEATRTWLMGRLVVATVGALSRRKNTDMFVDLAARVCRSRCDVAFLVVGGQSSVDPEMVTRVRRRIAAENLGHCVRLLGRSNDVRGVLPNVDIYVCTSVTEGCPNAVLEAMRARLPIVMTECTETAKLVEPGRSGYVVGVDDLEGMEKRMHELLNDERKRLAFGEAGLELVRQHFEASSQAWTMARIYLKEWVLRRGGPRADRSD
jgi:glycosyltransferase involved in cell wall biosynthesis